MLRLSLLCLALCTLVLPAQAQFTVTAADYQALYGQTYTNADYNATATAGAEALVGVTGGGQTWDFTTFPFELEANYTQEFIADVTGQTGAANFPDANHVIKADTSSAGEVLVYFSLRDDGVYTEGTYAEVESGTFIQDYDPALIGFALPLSFGSTWSGTSTYTLGGFATTQTNEGVVDGHGTLILPTGTFSVMRYRLDISIATTIPGFGTNTTTSIVYAWFTEDGQTAATITATETPFIGTNYSVGYSDRQGSGNTGGTAPATAPALASPADGSTDLATSVNLSWGTVDGATSYRVQVATDASFATTIADVDGLASPSYTASGLAEGTTYYWRAQGVNDVGAGPWSSSFSFSTQPGLVAPATAPSLTAPVDGATDLARNVSLVWTAVDGATGYVLQVATNPNFSPLLTSAPGEGTDSNLVGIAEGTTFYWRVRATNDAGEGPWSAASSFSTATSLTAPGAVAGLSPADGTQDTSLQPTLSWGSVPTAATYDVQLAADAAFTTPLLDVQATADLSADVTTALTPGEYYWRVRAVNAAGGGPWSSARFETVSAPSVAPANLSPSGATAEINTVTLMWDAVAGATGYDVEVATDAAFTAVIASSSPDAGTTTEAVDNLLPATTYHWRVRAVNGAGPGPWASASFTTALNTSVDRADVPNAYALHSNYPNPFNPSTQIRFDLPEAAAVTLDVFDLTGRLVERLVNRTLTAGTHTATFNATERPSGLYVYRLSTPNFTATRTMVLLK